MGSSGIKKKGVDYTWRNRAICGALCLASIWIFFGITYFTTSLFPETEMVMYSQCENPLQNWDGKILDFPVWTSSYNDRPEHFSLHNEKMLPANFDKAHDLTEVNDRVVVLWGTHHKTGTFLAKKLFAKVCAKLRWCCLFHVTRDSVFAVRHALHKEPVNALGHNQWIWHPKELNITKYRFIHFYRNPFRKIVSGYRYHADGTEPWTQRPQKYSELCGHASLLKKAAVETVQMDSQVVNRSLVFDYCSAVHLCETCCRKAHELSHPNNVIMAVPETSKQFVPRSDQEYDFICKVLGNVTKSVQHSLLTEEETKAIKVEAALEYYEILRMATLYNQTAHDPHTLNVDLDALTEHYEDTIWKILKFLRDLIPATELNGLNEALGFYNLDESPLYRWSMSNPIINHVTADKESGMSTQQLVDALRNDEEVMQLYRPILDLMGGL
ncbi:hypothetical protein EON65_02400 [archaeon]|nr:MAG: hypothetical protein EON65_02400 [archaeon]